MRRLDNNQWVPAAAHNRVAESVEDIQKGRPASGGAVHSNSGVHTAPASRKPPARVAPTDTGGTADPPPNPFWAIITGSTSLGGNQWNYTFVEVHATPGGLGGAGWLETEGGRSGECYNLAEVINSASGVQGNGVDAGALATNFPAFALKPCPTNRPLKMNEVDTGSGHEYWFDHSNAVDGVCE